MATIVSTPAELDAVRYNLGADYEIGANIDLDGYGTRFQRFVITGNAFVAGDGLIGRTSRAAGIVWAVYGDNVVLKLVTATEFMDGEDISDDVPITRGVSFSTAPYDGSVVQSWIPIGETATGDDSFTGSLAAADGVKITNMTVNSVRSNCGLIAFNSGDIRYVDITGDVTGGSPSGAQGNGLVAGINSGTIYRCVARGSVTSASSHLGGVIGYNTRGTIDECVNHADVNSSSTFSGGICGRCDFGTAENPGIIRNCYNTGTVTASAPGGIVGRSSSSAVRIAQITNCHNIGDIVGSPDGGGIYGSKGDGATFVGCKYLAESTGVESGGVQALSAADMRKVSNYDGWDFSDVWHMGAAYPMLRVFGVPVVGVDQMLNSIFTFDNYDFKNSLVKTNNSIF